MLTLFSLRKRFTLPLFFLLAFTNASAQGFPYPSLPDDLTSPEDRATYLLSHYWDNYDFSDTTQISTPEVTEEGLVNFLDLLPRFSSSIQQAGINHFVSMVLGDTACQPLRHFLLSLLGQYLADEPSPVRNLPLYCAFLHAMANSPQAEFAADFSYRFSDGDTHFLHDAGGDYIVVYFFDPDCDTCREVGEMLDSEPLFLNNRITLVSAEPTMAVWEKYWFRSLPCLYLLDGKKHIMARDVSPENLHSILEALLQP